MDLHPSVLSHRRQRESGLPRILQESLNLTIDLRHPSFGNIRKQSSLTLILPDPMRVGFISGRDVEHFRYFCCGSWDEVGDASSMCHVSAFALVLTFARCRVRVQFGHEAVEGSLTFLFGFGLAILVPLDLQFGRNMLVLVFLGRFWLSASIRGHVEFGTDRLEDQSRQSCHSR